MVGGVDARRPVDLFAVGEDGAGHLELAEFAGEGEQLIVGGFALRHVGEAVAEGEEGVEGDEVLIFENGADLAGEFVMDALAFGSVLAGAGEEIDDGAGGGVRLTAGCEEEFAE